MNPNHYHRPKKMHKKKDEVRLNIIFLTTHQQHTNDGISVQ